MAQKIFIIYQIVLNQKLLILFNSEKIVLENKKLNYSKGEFSNNKKFIPISDKYGGNIIKNKRLRRVWFHWSDYP